MVFSSVTFLWVFLPLALLSSFFLKGERANPVLLLFSLLFYAWGEPVYVLVMLFSIMLNWYAGLSLERYRCKKTILLIAVVLNLSILFIFKYLVLVLHTIAGLGAPFSSLSSVRISLPIGISFFTFQALSYVIDVYRKQVNAQHSLMKLALYISFFPQLIAGPIVRYKDVCKEIEKRSTDIKSISTGIRRFIYGLGKKVLIANVCAIGADKFFGIPVTELTGGMAWTGAILYTLQIYYDFSGYSDMAIGLGRMFGFTFCENFSYPYLSGSIREFWQRWHISLGVWFREYVYFPLGGNRKGKQRTIVNLLIVFLLTGIWHGAAWSFLLWGLYHGLLRILEMTGWGKIVDRKKWLGWCYTFLAVVFGWVLFRSESVSLTGQWIVRMIAPWSFRTSKYFWPELIDLQGWIAAGLGLIGALLLPFVFRNRHNKAAAFFQGSWIELIWLIVVLGLSMIAVVSGTYNPFIYFRF